MKYGDIVKFNGVLGEVVTGGDKFFFRPVKYGQYSCRDLQEITVDTVEPATFEEKVHFIEQEFGWGRVIKTHVIGNYQIIEYNDQEKTRFNPFINFKNCHTSFISLDNALIGVIAENSIEKNEARYAITFILKMLNKSEW